MPRLSPQVLVQRTRRTVEAQWKWKPTEDHAPPLPVGARPDDPGAELAPLDVRLLQVCGFEAYRDEATGQSAWPVPLGMSPHELALFGEDHGILYSQPLSGDIFLQRGLRGKEFVHAGLVMTVDGRGVLDDEVEYFDTSTVEGDTDHRGLLRRGYTAKLRRRLSPTHGDRFLRWSELEVESVLSSRES